MIIKEGFNSKPTHIRIYAVDNREKAEAWIEQKGLEGLKEPQRYETLAYATLDEIIKLRNECNEAIRKMAGL